MTEPGSDLWTPVGPPPDEVGRHGTATRTAPDGAAPARTGLTGASRTPRGAAPPARSRRRRWPWLVLVLVLIGVVALVLGVVRWATDPGPVAAPAPPPWSAVAPPDAPAAPGSLTAGVADVFAAAAGGQGLVALTGQRATGHAVPVQSVPADEGFWIGTGATDRVWVQLTGNSESAITITPGQRLDLTGPVVPHGPDFAGKAGVSAAEGAAQLTSAGAHLEVDPRQITVVGTA